MASPIAAARVWLVAVVACLALASCSFRLGYDDLSACSSGPDCDGPRVDAGAPNDDGGGDDDGDGDGGNPADAALPDPETGAPGCGSLQLLQDDFADGRRDFRWNPPLPGPELTEANGRFEAHLNAGGGDQSASQESVFQYDFRNSQISAEVLRVGGRSTLLRVRDLGGRGVGLVVEGGMLKAVSRSGDVDTALQTVPYSSTSHRFWRLRERAGQISWDTSADGEAWTTLHSAAVTIDAAGVFAEIGAKGQLAAASEAWIDNVNRGAGTAPGHCASNGFRDDFADNAVDRYWAAFTGAGDCTPTEANGQAELTFRGQGFAYCTFASNRLMSLRNNTFSFEMVTVPSAASFESFVSLFGSEEVDPNWGKETAIQVSIISNIVHLKVLEDGAPTFETTLPYNPVTHRFWRFREAGGQLYWESSGGGVSWETRAQTATPFAVDAVWIGLSGVQDPPGSPTPLVLRFDNVNLP